MTDVRCDDDDDQRKLQREIRSNSTASRETSPTHHLHLALWSGVLEPPVSLTQPEIDLHAFPSAYQDGLAQVVESARGPGPWSRLCRSQSWIEKAVASRYRGLALVPPAVLPVKRAFLRHLCSRHSSLHRTTSLNATRMLPAARANSVAVGGETKLFANVLISTISKRSDGSRLYFLAAGSYFNNAWIFLLEISLNFNTGA
ncbi:hypothetical protein C8R48DRAFT_329307 [Suillus tomentosus]|nr:hypothetical protein C8R48DRAFT_329307 [Suillus tomentosus]